MSHFAKLLTLTNKEQCLLLKQWNDEDKSHEVVVTIDLGGCRLSQKYGFYTEEEQQTMFEEYDVSMGDNLFEQSLKMLTD